MKTTAIVLAGGSGKRMNSTVKKQFLEIKGRPLLYYSLKAFQDSFIDEVILVTSEEDKEYCQKEMIEKYGFHKIKKIVSGGKERYHSVANGVFSADDCDFIFIHDGARPFINEEILKRNLEMVEKCDACVTGMPVKDTIKVSDENNFVAQTPHRNLLWQIQTPQTFRYDIVKNAYDSLFEVLSLGELKCEVTDDAMVVEQFGSQKVKLVEGDYRNIKLTTPEDMILAEAFLKNLQN